MKDAVIFAARIELIMEKQSFDDFQQRLKDWKENNFAA